MTGFIALLLVVAAVITVLTGSQAHWLPILLGVLVGYMASRSVGSGE